MNKLHMRRGVTSVLLAVDALATWVVAAIVIWLVTPRLIAEPEFAAYGQDVAAVLGAFLLTGALGGTLTLLGLVRDRSAPHGSTAARAVVLTGGLLALAGGMLLVNVGTLGLGWTGGAAVQGIAAGMADVLVGVVACLASVSHWLPGQSLMERMMQPQTLRSPVQPDARMLPVTLVLVVAWFVMTGVVVSKVDSPWLVAAFVGVQMGMPVAAGALTKGWRAADPNRLKTLALAGLSGAVVDLLFLLALVVTRYYRFEPLTYPIWWGLMGALLGAIGYGAWGGSRWTLIGVGSIYRAFTERHWAGHPPG